MWYIARSDGRSTRDWLFSISRVSQGVSPTPCLSLKSSSCPSFLISYFILIKLFLFLSLSLSLIQIATVAKFLSSIRVRKYSNISMPHYASSIMQKICTKNIIEKILLQFMNILADHFKRKIWYFCCKLIYLERCSLFIRKYSKFIIEP